MVKNKNISDIEMLKLSNCGGFCLITDKSKVSKLKGCFDKKFKPYEIGYISKSIKKNKLD